MNNLVLVTALILANLVSSQDALETPTCSPDLPNGTACWQPIDTQPDCFTHNPNPQPDAVASWTGECLDGRTHGEGTLSWTWSSDGNRKTSDATGRMERGQWEGHVVYVSSDGTTQDGPYVRGHQHGDFIIAYDNGDLAQGPYRHGKRHGKWNFILEDSESLSGSFSNGYRNGRWVWEKAFEVRQKKVGLSGGGIYVRGKKHGPWTEHWSVPGEINSDHDFGITSVTYVNGQRHGDAKFKTHAGKVVTTGSYRRGKMHGDWSWGYLNTGETYSSGRYDDGRRDGPWNILIVDDDPLGAQLNMLMPTRWTARGSYAKGTYIGKWEFTVKTCPDHFWETTTWEGELTGKEGHPVRTGVWTRTEIEHVRNKNSLWDDQRKIKESKPACGPSTMGILRYLGARITTSTCKVPTWTASVTEIGYCTGRTTGRRSGVGAGDTSTAKVSGNGIIAAGDSTVIKPDSTPCVYFR